MPLHPDRLFPAEPAVRALARELFAQVETLPIVSPHGHTDPRWFAQDVPFPDPSSLFIIPDHYVFRMLYSQGVPLEALGLRRRDGAPVETDSRRIWRLLADHWHLFRGTPTRMWFEHALETVFGIGERLGPASADRIYDLIAERLAAPDFRPRALFRRFNIAVLATTDAATDDLQWHDSIRESGWDGRVIPTYRPDSAVDPQAEGFAGHVRRLGEMTGEDVSTFTGYLRAHRRRRLDFRARGATATDHGHPTVQTADLDAAEAARLYDVVIAGRADAGQAELFRAQMLTEMARMSLDDGLLMQIHPGSWRNHNALLFRDFGRDIGADLPVRMDYVGALKPLLDAFGNERDLTIILFTLDESAYARELAPLAGHYPALKLGPAWWFHDSPEGMRRYREQVMETAGFYNTVGFNDDTRGYLSIPARHDMARRVDCAFLARLVAEHRLDLDEAHELAVALAGSLAKAAYRL